MELTIKIGDRVYAHGYGYGVIIAIHTEFLSGNVKLRRPLYEVETEQCGRKKLFSDEFKIANH